MALSINTYVVQPHHCVFPELFYHPKLFSKNFPSPHPTFLLWPQPWYSLFCCFYEFNYCYISDMGFPGGTSGKEPSCQCKRCRQETWIQSLSQEFPLEEGMAAHSSIFAWRIPMERGAGRASVRGVTKSHTRLKDLGSSSSYLREIMQYLCIHAQLFPSSATIPNCPILQSK